MALRTLLFALLSFICFFGFGQTNNSCKQAARLVQLLNENHIQPPIWGASFTREISQEFFQQIDPYGIYFSLEDADKVQTNPLSLSDLTSDKLCVFAQNLASTVEARMKQAETEINTYLNSKPSYAESDSFAIQLRYGTKANINQQKLQFRKYLKYQLLEQMFIAADTAELQAMLQQEVASREKIRARELKKIQRLSKAKTDLFDFVVVALLKSIAAAYDPHSTYFSNDELTYFQNSLSSSVMSFGLDFFEDEMGELSVNSIVPGGAAWQSNEVHEGDVILAIKWDSGEKISARDFSPAELQSKLDLNKNRRAEITIKKKDGMTATIKLEKSAIESDGNHVDGYVLKGKRKIGYIALPAFYQNWNGKETKGCANDVAAELIKLKKENIEGLILDLRFNGGGSIKEAMELAGIFINVGPLMILQMKGKPLFTLKDSTPGAAFDGPLVILVNGLSASASEMVAASLQDHQRALIVGTPTFGKSNGQSLFPIIEKDTVGHVKITNLRLYRITGRSYQRQGVQPDIELPDFSQFLRYNEKNLSRALPNDSIVKKTYYTRLVMSSVAKLRDRSRQRKKQSIFFQQFEKMETKISEYIPLEIKAFIEYSLATSGDVLETDAELESTKLPFNIAQNRFNDTLLQLDQSRQDRNVEFMEELGNSPYLKEAFQILVDFLELENKK